MTSVFVWYRIGTAAPDRAAASRLLGAVAARLGVRGRLYERREPHGTTWMEVYEDVPDAAAFESALAAARATAGGPVPGEGGLHVERFERLSGTQGTDLLTPT